MIQVESNKVIYNIPTNFDEISWSDFCKLIDLHDKKLMDRVSFITEIPVKELQKLDVTAFSQLCEYVSFIDVLGVAQQYKTKAELTINIGAETYGKLEKARQLITQSKNYLYCGGEVFKVYFSEDINDLMLPEAMTKVNFIYAEINKFLDKYKELYEGEATFEEDLAGIAVFQRFGSFPIIDKLATAWSVTHDKVLETPAEIVMTKLLYDLKSSEYQRNLFNLRSDLQKHDVSGRS